MESNRNENDATKPSDPVSSLPEPTTNEDKLDDAAGSAGCADISNHSSSVNDRAKSVFFPNLSETSSQAPIFDFDPDDVKVKDVDGVSDVPLDEDRGPREIHVFSMRSQGNVYSIVDLPREAGGRKLLAGCLSRPVYEMEFTPDADLLQPQKQEINFTYIPAGADIIAIDSFCRQNSSRDYVIGNLLYYLSFIVLVIINV